MKSVKVNIKFPSKTEAQKQLNTALEGLNSSLKINLDTKSFTSSIATMSKELNKLKTQLDKFGVIEHIIKTDDVVKAKKEFEDLGKIAANSLNIGNGSKGFSELQARANEIKNTVSELSKINYNLDADGNLKKAVITYKDNVGNVVTETMEWKKLLDEISKQYINVFETTNISVGDNVEKINKANEAMEKLKANMQGKLNIASDNNLINPSVIADLQSKLDSINTDTPEREINELKTAIANLSKSDSGIVRLQNAISSMESNIASAKSKYGTLIKSEDVAKPIEEVNKLKTALNDLQNGKSIDGSKISSMINAGNTSIRQMTTEAKTASSALKLTQKDAMSIGDAIKTSLQKFGIFTSAAMATRQLITAIKEGITYIKYLNDAYTDLSITMDITLGQFTDMTTQVHSIAKAMGSNAENVMDIVKVYANASTTIDEVMQKIAPSVALSNVARMDGGEVTKTIQATLNVFKMLEDGSQDVEAATERIGNVLVSVSRNMKYDFADGTRQLVSAIQEAGSVAEVSGVSLERYAAMVGAVVEATGKQGTEVATSFKFIAARILQIKELSEETDTTVEDMGKAEKALQKFGITIREGNGQLKSLDTILEEVAGRWSTMKDEEKQYLSEAAAGNRQRAAFINIMETMTKQQELYNTAMNSEGALMTANEKYVESFSGKVQTLQASFQSLASTTLNSDFIMGFIDALTVGVSALDNFSKVFGTFPTTVGLVVGAMTLLNTKFRENSQIQITSMIPSYGNLLNFMKGLEQQLITNIAKYKLNIAATRDFTTAYNSAGISTKGFGSQLLVLQGKLAATTAGLIATKVAAIALQAVISMGLSIAITAITTALTSFCTKLFAARKTMEECATEANNLSKSLDSIKSGEDLVSKYEELKKTLDNVNLSAERRVELEKELNSVKEQLSNDDAYYWVINNENLELEQQLGLLKQIRDIKMKEMMQEVVDALPEKSDMNNLMYELDTDVQNWLKMKEDIENAQKNGSDKFDNYTYSASEMNKVLKETEERIIANSLEVQNYNSTLELITDESIKGKLSQIELSDSIKSVTDSINEMNKAKDGGSDISAGVEVNGSLDYQISEAELLAKTYEDLGYAADEAAKRIKELNGLNDDNKSAEIVKDATRAYGSAISEAEKLNKILKQIQDDGEMTYDTVTQLASTYPEIGARITDASAAQEFLNEKIKEQSQIQSEAYQIMVGDDQAYYNSRLKNSEELQMAFNNLASAFVDVNSDAYKFDVKNYTTLNEAKAGLASELNMALGKFLSEMIGGNAEGYAKDLENFQTLAQKKSQVINKLSTNLQTLQNNQNKLFAYQEIGSDGSGRTAGAAEYYQKLQNEIEKITGAMEKVDTSFNEFNASFGGYTPSFGSSSSGIGSSGSSGSSSTSKKVADLEDLTDRYYNVNNAITQVENSLKALQTAMENSTEEEKMKLLQKEITLLYDKKKALEALQKEQQKEAAELKKQLSSNGFKFDKNGNVTNAIERLTQLTNQANKLTGDSKEAAIAKVKNLNETLKQYTDLLLDKIPDIADEINDMKNEVVSAQKEIASILEEQRDKYIDGLEKETDKLKTELEKRKQLMQQSWEEDDYKDELNKKQKALNDLEDKLALAMRTADEELIKSIRLQIQEAQDEINNFIRDNERENASNRFDEEMDKADEDLQNKIDEITSKLSEEEILKLVQQGVTDLSNILNKIGSSTSNVRTAFTSVGAVIEDTWIKSLDAFISKLNTIETLNPTVSFAANGIGVGAASNITINSGDIIIQGSADELTLSKIEKMLDENNRELIKEIDACFER